MLKDKDFTYENANEVFTLTEEEAVEKREAELTKRQTKFNNNIALHTEVKIDGGTEVKYSTKKGTEQSFNLVESMADYYLMFDQPDEPQYTAAARQSKGGRARSSDEA